MSIPIQPCSTGATYAEPVFLADNRLVAHSANAEGQDNRLVVLDGPEPTVLADAPTGFFDVNVDETGTRIIAVGDDGVLRYLDGNAGSTSARDTEAPTGEEPTVGWLNCPMADRPWLMRTYSGHSSARASNELYRTNLARGQTGLSVAFDLPTQTGYDPDHVLARGEVGKVGVPVPHIGEMHTLFDGIPLGEMNTSMTINATAMWLFGMYLALADEQGVPYASLQGTTQNDILKEYLSRGTYIFPPEASKRLTVDLVAFTVQHVPVWNPINVCPYHLQEAGASPVQELAYGLANAIAVLDAVRDSGQIPKRRVPQRRRAHLVLHRCRRALRRRDVQDARVRRGCGTTSAASATACKTRSCAGSATACRSTRSG